jgi:hypothetical protein
MPPPAKPVSRPALRLLRWSVACTVVVSTLLAYPSSRAVAAPRGSLDTILRAAAAYIDTYERDLPAIVTLEDYKQVVLPAGVSDIASRLTRAHMVTIGFGELGWIAFRDVFEVDGHQVRGREERLSRLLSRITRESLQQARAIASESARFNLDAPGSRINRTVNTPLAALAYLRGRNQSRSRFVLRSVRAPGHSTTAVIDFTEDATPRLISTNGNTPAKGTYVIDSATGRVEHSELRLQSALDPSRTVRAAISVTYALVPSLDMWLPASMDDVYELSPTRQTIRGHAVYSDSRRFSVTVEEDIRQ